MMKFIFFGALVFLIVDLSVLYYLSSELKDIFSKSGFNFVKKIVYDTSKWYDEESSSLWNIDRPDYVFPNDRLNYLVMLTSKLPYPIEIETDFQIFVGDKNVTTLQQLSHVVHLSPTQKNDVINFNFTSHEGGLNTVKVNLRIINSTNKVQLDYKTEIIKFDVQSQAIQLQVESNRNTSYGIIASGIISIIAVFFTGYQTLQSRNEKNQTIRAWMGDTGSEIMLLRYLNNSRGVKTREEWEKMSDTEKTDFNYSETEYAITIKNFGQIPAINVSGRYLPVLDRMPSRQEIISSTFEYFSLILPKDEKYHLFYLDKETTDAISDGSKPVYLIFEVRYNFGKSEKEYKFGFIANLSHGVYKKIDTWDEESFDKKS